MEEGWRRLESATTSAVAVLREAEAARSYRMIGSCASVLVEYDAATRWLSEGIRYAGAAELWNHRCYMLAHLAHVQWAVGQWTDAEEAATHALVDGRGGITTRITALYTLGYVALTRGAYDRAAELLTEALAEAEPMAELQRISPPLWGLAELALANGDARQCVEMCERGYQLSAAVTDAAYLFPYVITATRALLSLDDPDGAARWLERTRGLLEHRGIPGTLAAVRHATGLIQLASGEAAAASENLAAARDMWRSRQRVWESSWATLDLARAALRARRRAEAAERVADVQALAQSLGSTPLLTAANTVHPEAADNSRPWHPLTAREYEVATLVAAGMTNREIAGKLVVSPKTIAAHVEHILSKLGAARRAEIATWVSRTADSISNFPQ
jgi:DNA-binding CsgD family transcriptional regulator